MNEEKWQEVVGRILDDFEVLEHEKKNPPAEGIEQIEYIIFKGPLGKMKLERITKPLFLGKKAIGSKRIGSQTKVDYIFSETEKVHTLKAFKWNESRQDWEELEKGFPFNK